MHKYFNNWKFKHPQPADFKSIFIPVLDTVADRTFSYLNTTGILPVNKLTGFKLVSPLKPASIKSYIHNPAKNIVLVSPAIGANAYDKLMVGALISNYKLPPSDFQYLVVPLYGTGSKKFTGIGKLNYTITSDGAIRKTDIFLNASRFSMNDYVDSSGNKYVTMFNKLVPGVRITFREETPRSSVRKYIQWKTFSIHEDNFRFGTDTTFSGPDTVLKQKVSLVNNNYEVNQLQFVYENIGALYPFSYQLNIEQIN